MRVQIKFSTVFPHIKTLEFGFREKPKVDFILRPLKSMDLMDTPGLSSFLTETIVCVSLSLTFFLCVVWVSYIRVFVSVFVLSVYLCLCFIRVFVYLCVCDNRTGNLSKTLLIQTRLSFHSRNG